MRNTSDSLGVAVGSVLLGIIALFLGGLFQLFFVMIIVWVLFDYNAKFSSQESRLAELEKRLGKDEASTPSS